MNGKKRLNIGITVNLDNYENIRLETDGEAKTEEDAMELVAFLDGVLGRLGRGDEKTADRIDSYRRRVLAPALHEETAAPAPERTVTTPPGVRETGPAPAAAPTETAVTEHGETPAPSSPAPPPEERIPEPAKPEKTAPTAPEAAPAAEEKVPEPEGAREPQVAETPVTPAEDLCEECGGPVTPAQKKVSRMFLGRTLCKKCMPTM